MSEIKMAKGWSSHNAVLIKVIMRSEGDIIEMGAGPFSTPLLHWLCKDRGLRLRTYENDPFYYNFASQFQSNSHSIRKIENWNDLELKGHLGIIFIDHHPMEQRGIDVIRFKDYADYLILHDTEKPETYGYQDIWKHFKYSYSWKECRPWTSVVSNFKDLSWLQKN
jgi:hypothetical protein